MPPQTIIARLLSRATCASPKRTHHGPRRHRRVISSFAEGAIVVPTSLAESVKATRAEYRQVGRSGLRVSNPIMGTMAFGSPEWLSWCLQEDEASQLLYQGYLRGINTWDTANTYSNGLAERIIGRTIKKFHIPRRKLVLMTKVGRVVGDPETSAPGDFVPFMDQKARVSKDYVNQFGASRSSILSGVEASLDRLQTSYIDVLHLHRFDSTVEPDEVMQTLHQLVVDGRVRYLAASSMWTYQFAMLQATAERNGWTKFVAMQNHYNLLYREEEREMNRYCRATGVGLFPWSPLAEGLLARSSPQEEQEQSTTTRSSSPSRFGNEASEADRIIIQRVREIAERRGCTMSQVALAWLRRRVTAPIVGLHSVKRIEEALVGVELDQGEEAYLEEPYRPKPVQGHC